MILLLKNRDGFVTRNVPHDVMAKAKKRLDKLTPEEFLGYRQASKVFYSDESDCLSFEYEDPTPENPLSLAEQVTKLEADYYQARDALKLAREDLAAQGKIIHNLLAVQAKMEGALKRFVLVADDVRAYGSADRMCEHTAGCCNACDADLAFDRARQELELIL